MAETEPEAPEYREVFNVLNHDLVPEHEVISEEEHKELLANYGIKDDQLPKILAADPSAKACNAVPGDVVKITRRSPTAGRAVVFRLCVEFA